MSEVRLIDANALKETINNVVDEEIGIDEKWAKGLKYSLKIIDNAPTVLLLTTSDIDELCRLRSDLKSGLYVGSTLRTQAQMNKFVEVLDEIIDNAPTVESDYEWGYSEGVHDTERPQGEWILRPEMSYQYCCSICNKPMPNMNDYYRKQIEYCAFCGAEMRKDGAE